MRGRAGRQQTAYSALEAATTLDCSFMRERAGRQQTVFSARLDWIAMFHVEHYRPVSLCAAGTPGRSEPLEHFEAKMPCFLRLERLTAGELDWIDPFVRGTNGD